MRLSTSSHCHRIDRERNSNKGDYEPGVLRNRSTVSPLLSRCNKKPCGRFLVAYEIPFAHVEGLTCVATGNAVSSRAPMTSAVDGIDTVSDAVGAKASILSMSHGQRSKVAHEAPRNSLAIDSHASRHRNWIKSSRKANAISCSTSPTTVRPIPNSARWTNAAQDAGISSKPRVDTLTVPCVLLKSKRTEGTDATTVLPNCPLTFSSTLVPPPRPQDVGKLVVVLDLDETLVYSRDSIVYTRPGALRLLMTLKDRCEVIVWTAGTREYALDVIRIIDSVCAVQYCIFRHPIWWTGDTGCTKDLRLLGRPMDRVLLVDNTPSVFRANPRNSLLVEDFIVPYPTAYNAQEKTLSVLAHIFEHVFRCSRSPCIADVLASKCISRQAIRLEKDRLVNLNVLIPT
ncbi:hypothetical protein, conserved [Leishmania tarentolae]|uniref:Mitochondrial import inner membrane translocase subunit TIM50 n=1 Tax=Leishmania tarentolae TaxID=5689 RepID=A0A640KM25_LEITA|nr:hypothetical protein, conserved [Leishmania tarentolae]